MMRRPGTHWYVWEAKNTLALTRCAHLGLFLFWFSKWYKGVFEQNAVSPDETLTLEWRLWSLSNPAIKLCPWFIARGTILLCLSRSLGYRRGTPCFAQELEEIRRNVRDAAATADSASFVELFSSAVYLKPFIISLMLMFFQQFCGINGILFYLNSIFAQTGSDMDPGLQSFLVGLAQVTFFCNWLVARLNRFKLFFRSLRLELLWWSWTNLEDAFS